MNTTQPALIELNEGASAWMSQAIPVALRSAQGWQLGPTDEFTLLPCATKDDAYQATFNWCDPLGREMEHRYLASHVSLTVGGEAPIEDCQREQIRLAKAITDLRDATCANFPER